MDIKYTDITCPHCGHALHIEVDCSNGDQDYYEDCANCCNPIRLIVHLNEIEKTIEITVSADDEQIY